MNRQQLWERLKKAGITQSKLTECPPDTHLKIVIQCAQVPAKTLVEFLLSLDTAK